MVKVCRLKKEPCTKYAVKIMRVPDKEFYDIAMQEFKMISELEECPYIIKVYDIFNNPTQEKMYILMELAGEGMDLSKHIKKTKSN